MAREIFLSVTLALLLFSGQFSSMSAALEAKPPYPAESDIVFQWSYSCDETKGCSFSCPGVGGASHVLKLTIYMGSVRINGDKASSAYFYEFSTRDVRRGNGFSVNSGLNSLACQVNGMVLDYSGPLKSNGRPR
jgi:hypothetical protein